jgi:23S rRNA (cytosine1962-C5)-methyltransferase
MRRVVLRKTRRLLAGHPWVFSNELAESPAGFVPGEVAELYDSKGDFLAVAYLNPHSLISARVLSREKEEIGPAFLKGRIEGAAKLRGRLNIPGPSAFRLVNSEGDFLPGLVIDKYADVFAVQLLTAGMEALKEEIIDVVEGLFAPRAIVMRNDSRVRELEGLALYKEVARGTIEPLPSIEEDGVRFEVNPLEGQKTGFFLDQGENRVEMKKYLAGRGLDLFCYSGGWGTHIASGGKAEVSLVDDSGPALAQARRNAQLNGLEGRMEFVKADVFEFLKEKAARKGKYDFIVLDPPAFVKSAKKIKEALKAYRLLNRLAMELMIPGGMLVTSSCSYHIGREDFLEVLRQAGRAAGKGPRLLAFRGQSKDHPVLLAAPETEYLKCALLQV